MSPSPNAPEVYEISHMSSPHMAEIEEDIQISDIEENYCYTSMQTFTRDFPLNFVQNLPIIVRFVVTPKPADVDEHLKPGTRPYH